MAFTVRVRFEVVDEVAEFAQRRQLTIGQDAPVDVLRDGKPMTLTIKPDAKKSS